MLQSEISVVFRSHESLFVANVDRDILILTVYLIYENKKGEESFWYPYFNVVDPGIPACYWSEETLAAIDC